VSDGLLADAAHLATASGVDVDVDRTALVRATLDPDGPLQQVASALGGDPLAWVLTGGEDHALLATFPAGADLTEGWAPIGTVREGEPGVRVDGEPAEAVAAAVGAEGTGHAHFR
jgi:thiamine-monophosphate kinase